MLPLGPSTPLAPSGVFPGEGGSARSVGAGGELALLERLALSLLLTIHGADLPLCPSPLAPVRCGGVIILDRCTVFIAMALPHRSPVFHSSCLKYKPDPLSLPPLQAQTPFGVGRSVVRHVSSDLWCVWVMPDGRRRRERVAWPIAEGREFSFLGTPEPEGDLACCVVCL